MDQPKMNVYQRIAEIMKEVPYIQKKEAKDSRFYNFVSHDQVTGKLNPLFVKYGVLCIPTVKILSQEGNRTSVRLEVKVINIDNPEDHFFIESWGYGIDTADKGPGKAISYAYKYALLKLFCLETGDDPDEEQDSEFNPEGNGLSPKQISEIIVLLEGRDDIGKNILNFYKVTNFKDIPASKHKFIIQNLKAGKSNEAH